MLRVDPVHIQSPCFPEATLKATFLQSSVIIGGGGFLPPRAGLQCSFLYLSPHSAPLSASRLLSFRWRCLQVLSEIFGLRNNLIIFSISQ